MDILITGESWVTHSIHIKGFDSFTTSTYEEGVHWLKAALESVGHSVRFMPNHAVSREFPISAAQLACRPNWLSGVPACCEENCSRESEVDAFASHRKCGTAALRLRRALPCCGDCRT